MPDMPETPPSELVSNAWIVRQVSRSLGVPRREVRAILEAAHAVMWDSLLRLRRVRLGPIGILSLGGRWYVDDIGDRHWTCRASLRTAAAFRETFKEVHPPPDPPVLEDDFEDDFEADLEDDLEDPNGRDDGEGVA